MVRARRLMLVALGCATLHACGGSHGVVIAGGDENRGRQLIERYGCGSCHAVPGIRSAKGQVGPPLDGVASRAYVGGIVPNTTDNMVAWLMHPQKFAPRTAMPDLGIDEPDARHIAAYLFTLK